MKLPRNDGESNENYEARLQGHAGSMELDKIPTFLAFGNNYLHLQSVIELNLSHYSVKLLTKSNSRFFVLCDDKPTKVVKLSNTSEVSMSSPTFIKKSHAEMAIYECITEEIFTKLSEKALNSAIEVPSTPAAIMKRNASSAISEFPSTLANMKRNISILISKQHAKKNKKRT